MTAEEEFQEALTFFATSTKEALDYIAKKLEALEASAARKDPLYVLPEPSAAQSELLARVKAGEFD